MADLTLVLLAAGMGSRYGGLKQLDPMGPGGETLMDYTVYDAIQAGFTRVVFVIRRDFEAQFREQVAVRYDGRIKVDLAFQDPTDLPAGFTLPEGRIKPWGTGHAMLAARHTVDGPFCVCNADDYYGRAACVAVAHTLRQGAAGEGCLVSFSLGATLSEHGTVSRGVCRVQGGCKLQPGADSVHDLEADAGSPALAFDTPVSMQFWGFEKEVLPRFWKVFEQFCRDLKDPLTAEFYLPAAVDAGIREGWLKVRVLHVGERWFGATYPDDKPRVQAALRELVDEGGYPSRLF